MAQALYQSMQTMPIDKISIKTLTDICGLNRQTFYYHFKDIYDLVCWMYVTHINEVLDRADALGEQDRETLRYVLVTAELEAESFRPIFESKRYYSRVRRAAIDSLTDRLMEKFKATFAELSYTEEQSVFHAEFYSLALFEFIERRARGTAVSTIDGFADNWTRMMSCQFMGERLRNSR